MKKKMSNNPHPPKKSKKERKQNTYFLNNKIQLNIINSNSKNYLFKKEDEFFSSDKIEIKIKKESEQNKKNLESKKKKIIENNISNYNEQELNTLKYNLAIEIDKRTYFEYYCSLLRKKHLIIFTFISTNDFNLISIKLSLFIMSFSLYLTINGFFFSDEKMHTIYINKGFLSFLSQIPQILYSTIITAIINVILKKLSLSEQSILSIKKQKKYNDAMEESKKIDKCIKVKFIIFFILEFLLNIFFWYFISVFCAVYNNTQILLIKDTIYSFCLSMIYPYGLNLLPGLFRIPSLRAKNKDKEYLYRISCLFALI